MATIYASLSPYVTEDYVTTGYVEGDPLSASFSTSIAGEILAGETHEGALAVSASFTQTSQGNRSIPGTLTVDASFTQDTTAINSIEGILSVDSSFTTDITAAGTVAGAIALDSSFTQTTDSSVSIKASQDVSATFTQTTTANVSMEATLALDGAMTTTMAIVGILRPEIYLDSTFTQVTTATNSIEALYSVGMLTSWSAVGSPTLSTTIPLDHTFSQDTTATNIIGAELSLTANFTQTTTAQNDISADATYSYNFDITSFASVSIEAASDYTATFTQETLSINVKPGALAVDSSFSMSATQYWHTEHTIYDLIDTSGSEEYVYADTTRTLSGNSSGRWHDPTWGGSSYTWEDSNELYIEQDFDLSSDFTIESWIYPDLPGPSWGSHIIFRSVDAVDTDSATDPDSTPGFTDEYVDLTYTYNPTASSRVLQFRIGNLNTNQTVMTKTSLTITQEDWSHIAVVRKDDEIKIYLNGTQITGFFVTTYISGVSQGTNVLDSGPYTGAVSSNYFVIGGDGDQYYSNSWGGNMDEFHIANSALYTTNFTPDTNFIVPNPSRDILLIHFNGAEGDNQAFVDDVDTVQTTFNTDATFTQTALLGQIHQATVSLSATFTQDTDSTLYWGAGFLPTATFTQDSVATNTIGFPTNCYSWDDVSDWATWDEWLICQDGTGLASVDFVEFTTDITGRVFGLYESPVDLDAEFTQTTVSTVAHEAALSVSAAFSQNTNSTFSIQAVSTQDAEFTQTTDSSVDHEASLALIFDALQVTLAVNVITAQCSMSATFDQTALGINAIDATLDVDSTFTQTTAGTTDLTGAVDLTATFTQDSVATNTANAILAVDGSFTQDTVPYLTLGPTIAYTVDSDMSTFASMTLYDALAVDSTFTQVTDYEGIWAGSIDLTAEFTQDTFGHINFEGDLAVDATFTVDFNAVNIFGNVSMSWPSDWTTDITAENQIDAFVDTDATFTQDTAVTLTKSTSVDVSAEFTQDTVGGVIPISTDRTLFVCAETRTINVYEEVRTIYPVSETRVMAA